MIISTTKCENFGHPEFVLEADEIDVPDIYIRELVQIIEQMVADGSVFHAGGVKSTVSSNAQANHGQGATPPVVRSMTSIASGAA